MVANYIWADYIQMTASQETINVRLYAVLSGWIIMKIFIYFPNLTGCRQFRVEEKMLIFKISLLIKFWLLSAVFAWKKDVYIITLSSVTQFSQEHQHLKNLKFQRLSGHLRCKRSKYDTILIFQVRKKTKKGTKGNTVNSFHTCYDLNVNYTF